MYKYLFFSPAFILVKPIVNFYQSFKNTSSSIIWTALLFFPIAYTVAAIVEVEQFSRNRIVPFLSAKEEQEIADKNGMGTETKNIYPFATLKSIYSRDIGEGYSYKGVTIYTPILATLSAAGWIMLLVVLRIGSRSNALSSTTTNEASKLEKEFAQFAQQTNTAILALQDDVINARRIARQANSISMILLVGGVTMAFAGVFVFYFTLADTIQKSNGLTEIFRDSLRPIGMLFFIEALSWFLLKQYQSSTQEYSKYLAKADKKTNYLIAFLANEQTKSTEERIMILTSLLQPTQAFILKEGETTEGLEMQKMQNSNPLFEMGNSIINKIQPQTKQPEK
jgi:hypothetical protein